MTSPSTSKLQIESGSHRQMGLLDAIGCRLVLTERSSPLLRITTFPSLFHSFLLFQGKGKQFAKNLIGTWNFDCIRQLIQPPCQRKSLIY
jgi:hypothetical protein